MTHSFRKIREYINVKSTEEFSEVLTSLSPRFFNDEFSKTKSAYLVDFKRLLQQVDQDFHYVWVLKQEKYAFQLRWKESVLKAHLDLLLKMIPAEYRVKKAV